MHTPDKPETAMQTTKAAETSKKWNRFLNTIIRTG
jgi:hypothetical protein